MAVAGTQVCCLFLWSNSASMGETVSSGLCDHPCIPKCALLHVLKNPKYPFVHPFTLLFYFKLPTLRELAFYKRMVVGHSSTVQKKSILEC